MTGNRFETQIFSIFGQCEAVAADMMIERHKLTRIEAHEIPETAAVNEFGQRARFAVVMPAKHLREFEKLCAELRA